ncbi:hypothetical protein GPECTOR_3g244 [Gonium pectorale]|uniref:non-specific serine/threonine protein kinase n=1 Tax=Gonium pectorale TaxID=33097 RepID=A0A150GZ13_GONPE|nr:hypothetical protein GPECTOR_3g244 [Gonium pectorale]|eukprot:KXZ55089.1 hypothetical protein GPECTOR_3g244 [Gonium pectorale]
MSLDDRQSLQLQELQSVGLIAEPSLLPREMLDGLRTVSSQPQDQYAHPHPPDHAPHLGDPHGLHFTASAPLEGPKAAAGSADPTTRPRQPLIPVLNLTSVRRGTTGASARGATTDTGRTVPLSAMLRGTPKGAPTTNGTSLAGGSALDSCASPPTPGKAARLTGTSVASNSSAFSPPDPPASSSSRYASAATSVTASTAASASACRIDVSAFGNAAPGVLQRIPEAEQPLEAAAPAPVQAATYEELACRRLLYQDPATHLLLLKILLDLLVSPAGGLDSTYVPQRPADGGLPHAEYILLWHLNAPRNAGVVNELCRRAQRRAALAAAASAAAAPAPSTAPAPPSSRAAQRAASQGPRRTGTGGVSVPSDSARDHPSGPQTPAPAQRSPQPSPPPLEPQAVPLARPAAVSRALQLLSRPLFDATRYSNLQFVARGAYGGIYRARLEPVGAQPGPGPLRPAGPLAGVHSAAARAVPGPGAGAAAGPVQVVIKTIPLPGSPFDGCVLADVFGEVSIMERFTGHECICQLLDYGMHDDAYWIVMRRYRCSLADWRARQRPLGDAAAPPKPAPPSVRAAACVYLSALAQIVEALRLLAAHHVIHFDLKCSNVLIEPLPGVRDGELWAPVGGVAPAIGTETDSGCGGHCDGCGGGGEEPRRPQCGSGGDGSSCAGTSSVGGATSSSSGGASTSSGSGGGASAGGGSFSVEARAVVPFRCVLADFGEARAYRSAAEAFTARNRGTEVFKSPEMLLMDAGGRSGSASASGYAAPAGGVSSPCGPLSPSGSLRAPPPSRLPLSPAAKLPSGQLGRSPSRPTSASAAAAAGSRPGPGKRQVLAGAGLASDVWSLGCLAYELLSGTVLFGGDYASVTHRVAFGSGERLTLTEAEQARLGRLPQLVGLVEWILARDPAKRPSLEQIAARIQQARAELGTSC